MSLLGIDHTPQDAERQAALARRANTIFILSLVSVLFCCIGGIIASIIAHRAKNDIDAGNLDGGEGGINRAMVIMIISFVIGVLSILGRIAAS